MWVCVGIMKGLTDRRFPLKATRGPKPDLHKHAAVLRTLNLLKKQEDIAGL